MFHNSRKQGAWGLCEALAFFAKQEYPLFLPVSDGQRYDFIVEIENQLKRVEVKSSTNLTQYNSYTVSLCTNGGNQSWNGNKKTISSDDCDIVFIVTEDNCKYLIPSGQLTGRATITVGRKWTEYLVEGKPAAIKKDREKEQKREQLLNKVCADCQTAISSKGIRCRTCAASKGGEKREKIDWPNSKELSQMVKESNYSRVGHILNVSDNAVRKRLKNHP